MVEILIGFRISDLFQLFKQNNFAISPQQVPKLQSLAFTGSRSSIYYQKEKKRFAHQIINTEIKNPPIFILGHWRSGTTFFHQLLSLDEQFNYPTVFEVYNPHNFLITEPLLKEKLQKMDAQKRPMDNVSIKPTDPAEEEFAISAFTLKSPVLGWAFPRNERYYDRYINLIGLPANDINKWKASYVYFLKKLSFQDKRPLLLKSPPNTARSHFLRALFPQAKFIHIYRNPYTVYQSTEKLYRETVRKFHMQKGLDSDTLSDRIINRYKDMYDQFFADQPDIPDENYFEICFEQLQTDFEGIFYKLYQHFNWAGFDKFKQQLHSYLGSNKSYQKTKHQPISEDIIKKINEKWTKSFERWNYPFQ
ncbi:MAG: hypothetical protein GF313_10365 [Caldithrix sp.]|nr:hypothetical protein [Caldithrix sp.]